MIESKAAEYRKHMGQPSGLLQKGARAIFDPKLGPSGGYRCPEGSQFGGYITDRFGRGCGGGIIRRVGRAFGKLGRGLDNIADRRDRSRLGRAVNRRSKPNRVARAAGALERGAQRLVGEYKPGDYKPGDGGRRNRRNLPGGPSLRRSAVPRKPKRERKLPKDGDKKPRTQGATPKKRPIIERAAEGLERAAQRVLDEDRKKRTQGAKPAKPKKPVAPKVPSLKPNVSEDKKRNITDINDIDWDNLTPEQRDEIQGIRWDAISDLEDKMSKYIGVPKERMDPVLFLDRNERNRNNKKYQADVLKWRQLHNNFQDMPAEAIKEIDWTDGERKKILDVVNGDVKPDLAKDGGEFDWDNLTPEQRGKIKDIANNALEDDKKALLKHFGAASWNNDRVNRAIDLADKGFIKKDKANEIEKIALRWNLLQTQWNDEPNLAINDINWTDDQRQQIRDAIGIEAPKKPKTRGADFWERRKNNKPIKPEELDVEDAPEIFSSKPDGTSESNRLVKAWEQAYGDEIDKYFAEKNVDRLEKLKNSIDFILNKKEMNLSPAMRRMLQEKINDIDKKVAALRVRKARGARTATPKPKLPSLVGKPVSRQSKITRIKDNVIDALRIKNRRENAMGDFAPDAIGDGVLAFPENIVNDDIKNVADAVKWLDDGKSLYEIPQHYWLEAVTEHVDNARNPQYNKIPINNPGVIKKIFMFEKLDKDGKGTGTGVVFARAPGNARDGMGEVMGQQVLNALGMNVAPARFDGIVRDPGGETPVAVMPFAWNRAAQGDMQRPVAMNFDRKLFDQFEDKGFPVRLGNLLGNYFMGVGDRHTNNAMMAIVDGQPHIVPIDLGWNGNRKDFYLYAKGGFQGFSMDPDLYDNIANHLATLDPAEAKKQRDKLVEVFDGMVLRGDAIVAQGKDKFIKDAVAMMHLGADPVKNESFVVEIDRKELESTMEKKASDIFDALEANVAQAKNERARLFDAWGMEDVPSLGVLEVVRPTKPKTPKVSTPKVSTPKAPTSNASKPKSALERIIAPLRISNPQKRNPRVPILAEVKSGELIARPKMIENPKIKNRQNAKDWLDNGGLIEEVPQRFWAQALSDHVNGNAAVKQYKEIDPSDEVGQGAVKTTRIYLALDENGKPTAQGFLIQREGGVDKLGGALDRNNVAELVVANMLNAFGLNYEPARLDGQLDEDGKEDLNKVPAVVIPFAWNGGPNYVNVQKPSGWNAANFDRDIFDGLADKAYPQRLAAFLGNLAFAIPDRHDQNQMGQIIDGVPMVVPIDFGWAGKYGPMDFYDYLDGEFEELEPDFFMDMQNHLNGLDKQTKIEQTQAIKQVWDNIESKLEETFNRGKDQFINDFLDFLTPEQRANTRVVDQATYKLKQMYELLETQYNEIQINRPEFLK
jgi:predicted kinase